MVRHFDDLTKEVTAHYDLMVLLERIKIKLNYNIRYVSQRNSIIFFFFFFLVITYLLLVTKSS